MTTFRRSIAIAVVLAVAAGFLALSGPSDAEGPTLTASPEAGPTGTSITVQASDCFLPGGEVPGDGLVVRLLDPSGGVAASETLAVTADGSVHAPFSVPGGTPSGTYAMEASCAFPGEGETALPSYRGEQFTVTGEGPGAASPAAPATPPTGSSIEPYPQYDGQSTCSPTPKPGTVAYRNLVLQTYAGTSDFGISRACNVGGTSEHKEGRAWDWGVSAASATGRAQVADLMAWLFRTDQYGNRHAMARRLGLMYIIWNRQIFRMYRASDGWQPYSGSNPHTDHVHFSLTRAGGNGTTSFWSASQQPALPPATVNWATFSITVGGNYLPVSGDFDGDGRSDILWYQPGTAPDYVWYGNFDGTFGSVRVSANGNYWPITGDWDADGLDDIFWYGPGANPDGIWYGAAGRQFTGRSVTANGDFRPTSGDYDGDGRSDILWYGPGTAADWIWFGYPDRQFRGMRFSVGGVYEDLASGDFDNDGRDDVFFHDLGTPTDYVWYGNTNRTFAGAVHNMVNGGRPIAVDQNGDGDDDLVWYGAGSASDELWSATGRQFVRYSLVVGGTYRTSAGDYSGNGLEDVLWYGVGSAPDYIWFHRPT